MGQLFLKDSEGFWFNINVIEHLYVQCILNVEKKHEFIIKMRVNSDSFLSNSNSRTIGIPFDSQEEAQQSLDEYMQMIGEK